MTRMTRTTLFAAFAAAVLGGAYGLAQTPDRTLLIRNGTVIDGTGTAPRVADVSVVDGKIAAVGTALPASGGRTIDATGKFVVPGLIDTHAHLDSPIVFQLTDEEKAQILAHTPRAFLYNGVTTVLNLSSDPEWIWKM